MSLAQEQTIQSLALHRNLMGDTIHHQAFDLFAKHNTNLLSRATLSGHVTGSALVLDTQTDEALVVYATKFNKWVFSAGGHIDDGETPWEAATRELHEETGIDAVPTLFNTETPLPLLFDVHPIPASVKKAEPAHWHYDMVFLFETNGKPKVTADPAEVAQFIWKPLGELKPPVWSWDVERELARLRQK